MTTTILAQIRAIRTGHSERAQVHAVSPRGEYKLEVPTDEVPGVVGDMIVLSWTVHANPAGTWTAPATEAPVPAPVLATAADVDNQFAALMRSAGARQPPTADPLTPEQQLAALLGVRENVR